MIHGAGFVPAVHHAVGAFWVAALVAVALPLGFANQLLEGVRISVLKQVAGLLPAEDVVRRHSPRCALIFPAPHKELQEKRAHVEFPLLVAIAQDIAEEAAGLLPT